ncbi:MAG: 2-C-methyl-D-erythritol 4-phosphate cytidylyltransferase [Dysgonamonadaceae bacterium]|jgi:2-C-methyl-D-erythritol 4-phosphate cytidylyltransferase|nr:2-C-methyl-D-erythritol 4-phosphate cytidylyltransferase [Dysgonamonadaceae bacterium]
MKKYAVIVASGKGSRMGTSVPKQFLPLRGKPILMYSMEAFYKYDIDIKIVIVISEDQQSFWYHLCRTHHFNIPHEIVAGGETRFHSVKNALDMIENKLGNQKEERTLIAIHDGARPLVNQKIIDTTFKAAGAGMAACPVIPAVDSIRVKIHNGAGTRRVDRDEYLYVQTPQVFPSRTIFGAYLQPYSERFTDDMSVVELSRRKCLIKIVEGSYENIKITTPFDLAAAEAFLNTTCRT